MDQLNLNRKHHISNKAQWVNPVITGFILSIVTPVKAHGGISALNGLLELMIMLAVLSIIVITWLIFIGVMVFAKVTTNHTFKVLRGVTYILTAVFILIAIMMGFGGGFNLEFLMGVPLVVLGVFSFTELIVFMGKRSRKVEP